MSEASEPQESSQPEQPHAGGYLQMLPVYLREGVTLANMTFSFLPWGSPGLSAASGITPGETPEPIVVLAYEWPVPWLRPTAPLDKGEIESLHLQRFSTDQRLAAGAFAFGQVELGDDPPDFRVHTDGGTIAVDCTALTVEERRQAQALLRALRQRVVQVAPFAFAHLAGYMIYLWFRTEAGVELPYHPTDEAAVTELLEALVAYRPDPEVLFIQGEGLPDQAPPLPTGGTEAGATFYAVPFTNAMPDTVFAGVMGFELGLAFTTEHTRTSAWAEVQRLVASHDQEGVDWLLVSAGAPNRDGHLFPTEEVIASFLVANPQPLEPCKHIKRVTLHVWGSGEAYELIPHPERLFGPLFIGGVLPHRPLAPLGPSAAGIDTVGESAPTT